MICRKSELRPCNRGSGVYDRLSERSLSHGADDRQHEPAGGRARVERLRARHRQDPERDLSAFGTRVRQYEVHVLG